MMLSLFHEFEPNPQWIGLIGGRQELAYSEKIFYINLIPPTEKMFKINTVPKCPQKILQLYQAGENMGINVAGEFEVKTKDKTFSTSIFPFLQTDHLADQLVGKPKTKLCRSYRDKIVFVWHPIIIWCESVVFRLFKARQNFEEPSNRTFTYDRFSYKVVRVFFDQLHHVTTNEVSLADALDLMVFCNHEGQMDQQSEFETWGPTMVSLFSI